MMKKIYLLGSLILLFMVSVAGLYDSIITGRMGQITVDGSPGYDSYSGVVRRVTPLVNVSAGEAVYVSTSSGIGYPVVSKADADSAITTGDILVMISDANSNGIALAIEYGSLQLPSLKFTSGGLPVYVSNTSGLITETAPSTAGQIKQIIGYTESKDVLRVKPELRGETVAE